MNNENAAVFYITKNANMAEVIEYVETNGATKKALIAGRDRTGNNLFQKIDFMEDWQYDGFMREGMPQAKLVDGLIEIINIKPTSCIAMSRAYLEMKKIPFLRGIRTIIAICGVIMLDGNNRELNADECAKTK